MGLSLPLMHPFRSSWDLAFRKAESLPYLRGLGRHGENIEYLSPGLSVQGQNPLLWGMRKPLQN